jgi:hypothetical protein
MILKCLEGLCTPQTQASGEGGANSNEEDKQLIKSLERVHSNLVLLA